jgi:prepilin-type N-terminal cleavage/methylation domain-containing protein
MHNPGLFTFHFSIYNKSHMNKPYNLQPITYNLKPTSGFTLIELLVVVSIIFLITSVFISNAQEARAKARDVAKIEQARQVKTALAVFKNDRGATPGSLDTALQGTFAEGSTKFNTVMSTIGFSTPPKSEDRSLVYYDDGTHSTLLTTLESDEAEDKYDRCITSEGEYDCTYNPVTGDIVLLDSNGVEIDRFTKTDNEDPEEGEGDYVYNEPDDGDYQYSNILYEPWGCGVAVTRVYEYGDEPDTSDLCLTGNIHSPQLPPEAVELYGNGIFSVYYDEYPYQLMWSRTNYNHYEWTCFVNNAIPVECESLPGEVDFSGAG